MCACSYRSAIDVKVIHRDVSLARMLPTLDLSWALGVKSSAAEAELVLVVLRMLNS